MFGAYILFSVFEHLTFLSGFLALWYSSSFFFMLTLLLSNAAGRIQYLVECK